MDGEPRLPATVAWWRSAIGRILKQRSDVGVLLAAGLAGEQRLDIGQPDIIGPSVSADRGRMAALVILTVDKQTAHAGVAHLSEGDLLRAAGEGGHPL